MATTSTLCAKSTTIEFVVNEASKITSSGIISPMFTLQNMNWYIRIAKCRNTETIRAYLVCKHGNMSPWSCNAKAKFKLLMPFNMAKPTYEYAYGQKCKFMLKSSLIESDTAIGWDIMFRRMHFKEDKFILECEISADAPKCAFWKHIMESKLVAVDLNQENSFIDSLTRIVSHCNYLHATERVYSNISFADWMKNLFNSINSDAGKIIQIFMGFDWASSVELKTNLTQLLNFFFDTIKASATDFPIPCMGLQRIYIQIIDGRRLVVESKTFFSIPFVSGNVYKSLDAFKIVQDTNVPNINNIENGSYEYIIDTLPQYLIFTIQRNQQQVSVEFTEEIDLKNYTSANTKTIKYTLCAFIITTEVQPYFSIGKCLHNNTWIAYDTKDVFECSEADVIKHVESDAVLLVYKWEPVSIENNLV